MNKASVEKPWLKHFSEEARKAVIPKETIYTRIRKVNAGHDSDIALNYFDNRISYGKMFRNIDATAAALEQAGVKVGDVVSLCSEDDNVVVTFVLNLHKVAGFSYVPLDGIGDLDVGIVRRSEASPLVDGYVSVYRKVMEGA